MKDWRHKQQPWTWVSGCGMWNKRQWVLSVGFSVDREVGIECQEVPGHSKGIGYRQGQSLQNVKSDHLWNAVLLGGQWFLLDACWGAGRVDMEHESFVKRSEKKPKSDSAAFTVRRWCSYTVNVFDPEIRVCSFVCFHTTENLLRVGSQTSLLSPSVASKVRWFLFPNGPRGVHRFTLPRWGQMAAPGRAHQPGGVWEESLQDLSLLHHGAPADSAASLLHHHRSVQTIILFCFSFFNSNPGNYIWINLF